jgi:cyclophilin family peptidyl-prolyl cis-trans isomerase
VNHKLPGRCPSFVWSTGLKIAMLISAAFALSACAAATNDQAKAAAPKPAYTSYGDLLKSSQPSDWRALDAENTLYLELAAGRVVMELAPAFAPQHAANIKALAREGYFNGLVILRVQENYVVQWGDPSEKKLPQKAKKNLSPEFTVAIDKSVPFTRLPDVDGYAKEVGFSNGFHSARDAATDKAGEGGRMWLAHCYGTLGVGRDNDVNSGGGTELYVVIGHAPRHLDRNITLVGRVVQGMSLLTTLPRGTGQLGFYEKPTQHVPIKSVRVAADVPVAERTPLEVIRTDTPLFRSMVEALRNRGGEWYKVPARHIELCNVPIAVREKPAGN